MVLSKYEHDRLNSLFLTLKSRDELLYFSKKTGIVADSNRIISLHVKKEITQKKCFEENGALDGIPTWNDNLWYLYLNVFTSISEH